MSTAGLPATTLVGALREMAEWSRADRPYDGIEFSDGVKIPTARILDDAADLISTMTPSPGDAPGDGNGL